MKKLSDLQLFRMHRRLLALEGLRTRRKRRATSSRRRLAARPFRAVIAPREFCLTDNNRNDLLLFISRIKKMVRAGQRRILIDFTPTRRFIADGTLYFYAIIDNLLSTHKNLKFKCIPPIPTKPSQVLQQIGFYSRIGTHTQFDCDDDEVVNWRAATGQGALGEKYDEILGHYDGHITKALSDKLYTGLTEAMTNANHHAYLVHKKNGAMTTRSYKPWWMFSQEREGLLTVVFCDIGIGIPGSLPFSKDPGWMKWWTVIRKFGIHKNGDGEIIRRAVRHSKTRTQLHHRGKGLRQIIETVSAITGGKAIIQSNRGWYRIENGKEDHGNRRLPINGTILFWQIPLN
ncbi:hypothetical protein PSGK_09615 [Pseudomonas solani]|uniref:hypothetical protein n=1 Tax=Pseudomonas solani TaxID=2731552 RepID=UPI0035BE613E